MCRNIKPLFNYEPPATEEDIRGAALQYVRKISGYTKPSKVNEAAFQTAVDEIAAASASLLAALETNAPPRNREAEIAKAKARSARRFSNNG
ncbi:MAG TPA: DUF2277 domain-containing protein [Anaerolineales bacterium]|nr:DUF2277 domain-containing protein [Anaerolineales bacterium]